MVENIEVLCHSSIKFNMDKKIYIDPFRIDKNYQDADIIFITHDHYDHFSEEDINRVKKEDTIIVVTKDLVTKALKIGFTQKYIIAVEPNNSYMFEKTKFETVPAYNINKTFHPKNNGWVGYIIQINHIKYYIAGDTDVTEENKQVKCDIAFIPVGGTYTMDFKEAAHLVNTIRPKVAIPIHYGEIVGTNQDAIDFMKLVHPSIKCYMLIK